MVGRLLPVSVQRRGSSNAPPVGSLLITDALGPFKIIVAESLAAQTETLSITIKDTETDILAAQTESLQLTLKGIQETLATQTEVRKVTLRCWASGCTTNETAAGNNVNPSAANGQNDAVFAQCHTGSGTPPSTVNPNTVTTGSMNVPSGLTVISAKIRLWFKTGAIIAAVADNISIKATSSGGYSSTPWQGPALATLLYAGEDHSSGDYTFDVSSLTLTQLQNMQLQGSYTAGILALPQTTLQIDAWALDIEATI